MFKRALVSLVIGAAIAPAYCSNYCFTYKEAGQGKPLILIPGLTCTGDVWSGTVDQLKDKYHCYILTLPGFGGQRPIQGPFLPHVRDDIIAFVKDKHLEHPSVIGHSLGGFMVWYLGCSEPKLFGPMVSVDGLPFLSAIYNPSATAQSMRPMADAMAAGMAKATKEQFEQQTKSSLDSEVSDPKQADALLPVCEKSDPGDVAQAVKEMMTTDLRQDISKIQTPVLLIGAGQWMPNDQEALHKSYADQIAACTNAKLVIAAKCRHFIMYDDPSFFYKTVKSFLNQQS